MYVLITRYHTDNTEPLGHFKHAFQSFLLVEGLSSLYISGLIKELGGLLELYFLTFLARV